MAELNPLTGRPLEPYQQLVVGPVETGPRQTVVDARPGAVLPPWILRLVIPIGTGASVTTFVDNGAPGGTYQPDAYQLPELVTTAPRLLDTAGGMSWGLFVLVALGLVALAMDHGRH